MPQSESNFDPPLWLGVVLLGSAVLALVTYVLDGALAARLSRGFAVVAGSGVLYLLYRWGQHRDPPSGGGGSTERREKEMEAEAGGYGGSGGGT